jgi:hypothetical protein
MPATGRRVVGWQSVVNASLAMQDYLAGGGDMGALMRAADWSRTVFGPVAEWPQSLRTAISIMLESRFAMVVAWGPDFRFFYNDRYRPVLGTKHPASLGAPDANGRRKAMYEPVHGSAPDIAGQGLANPIACLMSFAMLLRYSLDLGAEADRLEQAVGAVLEQGYRTADIRPRRRRSRPRPGRRAADAQSPEQACTNAAQVLDANPIDVPFASVYLLERDGLAARRVCGVGIASDHPTCTEVVAIAPGSRDDVWQLGEVVRTGRTIVSANLIDRVGPLPGGPYDEPAHTVILLPLTRPTGAPVRRNGRRRQPARALDDRYRDFFEPPPITSPPESATPSPCKRRGARPRRWPNSIASRRRSSATSATSSERR